jgi:predicted amidohydrolase YtcJ
VRSGTGEKAPALLFSGGPIRTMSGSVGGASARAGGGAVVEAVLVEGRQIRAVGSVEACRSAATTAIDVIDLRGQTLLPGFVDAHTHPLMLGQTYSWVDCSAGAATDVDAVVTLLRQRAELLPDGTPVRGFGYKHYQLAEKRHVEASDLDRVANDREVMLMNASGHGVVLNSYGLARHGITRETRDPAGGHIVRDAAGHPSGLLWDAACDLITGNRGVKVGNHGPNLHVPDDPETMRAHLRFAEDVFLRAGITTVGDAQVTKREAETYLSKYHDEGLRVRVDMYLLSSLLPEVLQLGLGRPFGDDWLRLAGVKFYVDGSLGGGTAYFPDGVLGDSCAHGQLYHGPDELTDLVGRAHAAGVQAITHAQSPAAIGLVLDALEAALESAPRNDHRHRIEHCGLPTDDDIRRMAVLGVLPVPQPQHAAEFADGVVALVGELGLRHSPSGLFEKAGLPVILSSDAPVVHPNPFVAMSAAVTRRSVAGSQLGGESLRISLDSAMRGYTTGGAFALHRESAVGSIEVGKFADLVVVDSDPYSTPVDALAEIRVNETWVDGGLRFAR